MLLTIDAGNTNILFAVFDNGKIISKWRTSTTSQKTAEEFAVWLIAIMEMKGLKPADVTAGIISSVVPDLDCSLKKLCTDFFDITPLMVSELKDIIDTTVNRDEAGADRLVNSFAALNKYGKNLIIIDFGTATTFDVVNDKGQYIGGAIAPGINLSLEALHEFAAKLPRIAVSRPEKIVGNTTVSAMQSGIFWGYVGLIEGLVSRIKKEQQTDMTVIATGGLAPLFFDECDEIEHLETDLTIYGLLKIFENLHQDKTYK